MNKSELVQQVVGRAGLSSVCVDDLLPKRRRVGHPPRISDAELIALAVAQMFLAIPNAYALSDGTVFRTYLTTARGLEPAMAYYALLDRTPKGRDEDPGAPLWLRRHDEY